MNPILNRPTDWNPSDVFDEGKIRDLYETAPLWLGEGEMYLMIGTLLGIIDGLRSMTATKPDSS